MRVSEMSMLTNTFMTLEDENHIFGLFGTVHCVIDAYGLPKL